LRTADLIAHRKKEHYLKEDISVSLHKDEELSSIGGKSRAGAERQTRVVMYAR
jgi:hypothetical protein